MSVPLQSASPSPGFGLSWQLRVVMEICLESGYGVVNGGGRHTECLRGGICLESQDGDISSESESESGKVVEKGVPLQSQDGDISLESESELGKVVGKGVPLQWCPIGTKPILIGSRIVQCFPFWFLLGDTPRNCLSQTTILRHTLRPSHVPLYHPTPPTLSTHLTFPHTVGNSIPVERSHLRHFL